ncbi:Hypothetical predicted protein [Olea europaea subsp. europaea]|uniref:Uncharacterized protein n=1 Tax=Olea europaea subsp. europaea TaxID=158383 RepID=A0A8S0SL08_OLEEU|nr:Hypothetical predicted protein [Olea europaea subsp. europaea]
MARMDKIASMYLGVRTRMLLAKMARTALDRMASKLPARMLAVTLYKEIGTN